ncbi:MAG TPA: phosphatidate cytidylyltransferase [Anaerolineaceae bacterium]|nr:phosphatidate cytidylyltransferase [Anaerolineaceae bacterium]HOA21719.1 phosphatidate cytidylyltransferase [Anaerolineaceae bacterium]HOG77435.1 phosphatidate cytidylyltransferase [Anaerolineaceae bacterium]
MFWTRFKSALVFVPLMLAVSYLGGAVYAVLILAALGLGTWEYWRLLKTMGYFVSFPLLLGGVLALMILRLFSGFALMDLALVVILIASAIISLDRFEKQDAQAVLTFALHVSGILYIGWLGGYFFSLRSLPNGAWWTMLSLGLVMLVDLGAYLIGVKYGKHKIFPRLSPRKSWEGYAGGVLFGAGFGALLALILPAVMPELAVWEGALMGLVIGALTPFGDIFVSMLKRIAGVKDSGNLIPGHGGILDRTDTWIWAVMLGYYLAQLFS